MSRTMLWSALLLVSLPAFTSAQPEPEAKKPADPRDELRYDGKPFAHWDTFLRTELKAEKRIDAVQAMAAFGCRGLAKEAAAAIVEMLKEYDHHTMPEGGTPHQQLLQEAFWALGKIGPDAWTVVLAHLDHQAVRRAAGRYEPLPISASAAPVLVRWIASPDDEARDAALRLLSSALSHGGAASLRVAFIAAVEADKDAAATVAALAQVARKHSHRAEAVRLLGFLGPRAKAALPALVSAALDDHSDVRGALTEAFDQIKPDPAEWVAALVSEIKNQESERRRVAANKLAEMAPHARPALPVLIMEIRRPLEPTKPHRQWYIDERMDMLKAYIKIAGVKESLPVVNDLLERKDIPFERELVQLYLTLEKDPKRVTPVLMKSLERLPAPKADDAPPLLPPAIVSLEHKEKAPGGFLSELVHALAAQGEHAGAAVPLLVNRFEEASDADKLAIVRALGSIGPAAKEALPLLTKLLRSDNAEIRQAAAKAVEAVTNR